MTWSSYLPRSQGMNESFTRTTDQNAPPPRMTINPTEYCGLGLGRSSVDHGKSSRDKSVRDSHLALLDITGDSLRRLPSDIIINILNYLSVDALFNLSLTCEYLHGLVSQFGWTLYLRRTPRRSWSLSCIDSIWSSYQRVRYDWISECNWKNRTFVARPLSAPWHGSLRPELAISRSRLVVAAGVTLYVYSFAQTPHNGSDTPVVRLEGSYSIKRAEEVQQVHHDITSVAFLPDNGEDRSLIMGFADGYTMCVTLPDSKKSHPRLTLEVETMDIGEGPIESISVSGLLMFTLSGFGKGILRNNVSGQTASEMYVGEKCWSSYLPSSAARYVAIGSSSRMPLAVYPIHEGGLSPIPSAALTSIRASEWASRAPASAVYGITGPPPSFPGNLEQIIVSGWFDGRVRLFDLRIPPTSSMTATSVAKAVPVLSPVMSLSDPWATESIYSVSSGGGSGCTIAAGTARHSVVAFWDVRSLRESWSVHAPGNDRSPVYGVQLESSRLFGATQSRAFVCDFGPGVDLETYPQLPDIKATGRRNRRVLDDSLRTEDGVRYEVTKYLHKNPLAGG